MALVPIAPFSGMNDRDAPSRLPPGVYRLAQNVMAVNETPDSPCQVRPGTSFLFGEAFADAPCFGLCAWKDANGTCRVLYAGTSNLYDGLNPTIPITVNNIGNPWTWGDGNLFQFAYSYGQVYMTNGSLAGYGTNWRYDGKQIYPMGIVAPAVAPTLAIAVPPTPGGVAAPTTALFAQGHTDLGQGAFWSGILENTYMQFGVTFVDMSNPDSPVESDIGPVDTLYFAPSTDQTHYIYFLNIPICTVPGTWYRRIYRRDSPTAGSDTGEWGLALTISDNTSTSYLSEYAAAAPDFSHPFFPPASPAVSADATPLTGTYEYVYTYADPSNDRESDPSLIAGTITLANQNAQITVPACPDPSVPYVNLYRTAADGSRYYFVAQFTGTTYTDVTADADLGSEVGNAGVNCNTIAQVAKCIARLQDGRLVVANVPSGHRQLYVSADPQHPEAFPLSTKPPPAGPEDGGEIVCMVPLYNGLAVLCDDSVWTFDPVAMATTQALSPVGAAGRWCAQTTLYGVLFVSLTGIYIFDGNSTRKLSSCIQGTWNKIQQVMLPRVATAYDTQTDHFWAAVCLTPGGTANDTIISLDCRTLQWANPRFSLWPMTAEALAAASEVQTVQETTLGAFGLGMVGEFDWSVFNDGNRGGTHRGIATAASGGGITDSMATFPTSGAGLAGVPVVIPSTPPAAGARMIVASNTATQLNFTQPFASVGMLTPPVSMAYQVGAIPFLLDSGDVSHFNKDGSAELEHVKLFRSAVIEVRVPPVTRNVGYDPNKPDTWDALNNPIVREPRAYGQMTLSLLTPAIQRIANSGNDSTIALALADIDDVMATAPTLGYYANWDNGVLRLGVYNGTYPGGPDTYHFSVTARTQIYQAEIPANVVDVIAVQYQVYANSLQHAIDGQTMVYDTVPPWTATVLVSQTNPALNPTPAWPWGTVAGTFLIDGPTTKVYPEDWAIVPFSAPKYARLTGWKPGMTNYFALDCYGTESDAVLAAGTANPFWRYYSYENRTLYLVQTGATFGNQTGFGALLYKMAP